MSDLYRAIFKVPLPLTRSDFDLILSVVHGNYVGGDGLFERFKHITRHHSDLEFASKPIDLDTATLLKLRFAGRIEEIG